MTSASAIKENFTIKSQNRVAMVQTSKEITRWFYGCNFRLDLILLNTCIFWVVSGLDTTILRTMLAGRNCNLTFYKTRQLATWLQASLKCQVKTGFQAYSSKTKWELFNLLKFQLSPLQLLLIGPVTPKWLTRVWDFNDIRLRSRTWNSGILPVQCLFSQMRQSYAPFWQEVSTVIVAQFPELKLSRIPWDSRVQICSVFSISCL